jgi:predicted MFS family arabinose efflux permease
VRRTVDRLLPPRLGSGFRWLLASSWSTNLADGMIMAAGPLLVASQTSDALLIALAALLGWLPTLAFGLWAGAVTDRVDRRRLTIAANLARTAAIVVLCVAIATGEVSIAVVLVVLFVLGTTETFADAAASAMLPMLVGRDDLPLANARIMTGFVTLNTLAGPPLGALLFAAAVVAPFAAYVVLVGAGAALVARISLPVVDTPEPGSASGLLREIRQGIRWTFDHPAVRTLVLTVFIFNIAYGAAWSVLVLYSRERLGLGELGFGLLMTASALGGLAGSGAYGWITRHVSLGDVMRIGLIIETLTHLGLALTTSPAVAFAIFVIFGVHEIVWGTTSTAVRQRAAPLPLQGRVWSVNQLAVYGGLVVGAGIGGVLARTWGVTAPFWYAFVGSALFVVVLWRQLRLIAHGDDARLAHQADQVRSGASRG